MNASKATVYVLCFVLLVLPSCQCLGEEKAAWEKIQELLVKNDQLSKERKDPSSRGELEKKYEQEFEAIVKSLSAKELINTSRQACEFAMENEEVPDGWRRVSAGLSVGMLIDYYPSVAQGKDDFEAIVTIIKEKKEHEVLREVMINSFNPWDSSIFPQYLQKEVTSQGRNMTDLFRRIYLSKEEPDAIRLAAIGRVRDMLTYDYKGMFRFDPNVKALHEKTNRLISPKEVTEGKLTLEPKTVEDLKPKDVRIARFVDDVEQILTDPATSEELRMLARRQIESFATYPLEERERIEKLLEKYPNQEISRRER